jgi:hypothetical protein
VNDRAARINIHLDEMEGRIQVIGGIFAGASVHDRWPMPEEEYERIARRLDSLAEIARQHMQAYRNRDQWKAEAEARVDALLEREAA